MMSYLSPQLQEGSACRSPVLDCASALDQVPVASDQAVELLLHDLVAFARFGFQPCAVLDYDMPTLIANQPLLSKLTGGDSHACAPRAEHGCYELLSNFHIFRLCSVMAHQQPAGQPPVNMMRSVTGGGLRDLRDEGLRVAKQ